MKKALSVNQRIRSAIDILDEDGKRIILAKGTVGFIRFVVCRQKNQWRYECCFENQEYDDIMFGDEIEIL